MSIIFSHSIKIFSVKCNQIAEMRTILKEKRERKGGGEMWGGNYRKLIDSKSRNSHRTKIIQ